MTDSLRGQPRLGGNRLMNRRILVTGASSGMGQAIATLFAQEGAALALFDVQADPLADIAEATGGTPLVVDVSSEEQVSSGVAQAVAALGGLDGVVNAAGILRTLPFAETTPDVWRQVHAVNLFGPYLVCRAALPALQAAGEATIVNIASLGGVRASPQMAAYSASKAGLITLTQGLAIELGPHIRANSICPGLIKTPMTDALRYSGKTRSNPVARSNALQRKGTAMEVAQLALFLTSSESSFVNGQAYVIDGGLPNPLIADD